MGTIYLDNAATTPLDDEVREAMLPFVKAAWGNPSSLHRRGIAAREAIDRARGQVARAVGARPEHVLFTSGGTEANNLALLGLVRGGGGQGGSIFIGPTEHASIRASAEALAQDSRPAGTLELRHGELDDDGALDLDQLGRSLDTGTLLVAQMLVSNEFGSIYPVSRVAATMRARAPQALLHVDAIQALGKLPLSMAELGADSLSLSAHKVHGPVGVGALVLARDLPLQPLFFGGGQEGGLRSGTENLPGIVGFGHAAEMASRRQGETLTKLRELRERLVTGLARIDGLRCLASVHQDLQQPGILSVLVSGAPAEVWLHHLDARGVVVSVGSACQANKREVSPVLLAAGLTPEDARQVLRLSPAPTNTVEEIDRVLELIEEVRGELAAL
jgi:cysteine desulfurase